MKRAGFILTNKKSQVWGFDLMIALTIFLVGVVAAYIYAINFLNESDETLSTLFYEGNSAYSLILSSGTPENWNQEDVEIPGILSGGKINQTKLDEFYDLSKTSEGYTSIKRLLGVEDEFYFNFTEPVG
jgi:FlaG/FlaF family flagellin (archaellin)